MQQAEQKSGLAPCRKADMRPCETKRAPFSVAAIDEAGTFEGYASLFGKEDLGNDLIAPGAFRASLQKRPADQVRMLFQHDPASPIGAWEVIREDRLGLYVKGRLTLDVDRAAEIHALMKAGALDGLSIGFHTVRARRDAASGARTLLELDLWEISVVTFPMQPEARVSAVKAGHMPSERELERWLSREAGFSRHQARALISGGYKALHSQRDAGADSRDLAHLASRVRLASVQLFS